MRTGAWSRFGSATVPTGMVPIPGGTNAGTNALGVGESYSTRYPQTYSLTVNMGYDGFDTRYATDPYPYTSPVGSFPPPNGYGLYDMAGNVWEWCFDWDPEYWGTKRIFCGGCWTDGAYRMRVNTRSYGYPDSADYSGLGFRAVLSP